MNREIFLPFFFPSFFFAAPLIVRLTVRTFAYIDRERERDLNFILVSVNAYDNRSSRFIAVEMPCLVAEVTPDMCELYD